MEAAREMENLLSASLSQEQEISRELQRRVRDLQVRHLVFASYTGSHPAEGTWCTPMTQKV